MFKRCPSRGQQSDARRGVAAVEMALVLPVFLTVTLGIIEYGRALQATNLVNTAAREAGRVAGKVNTTNADVTSAAKEFLTSSLKVSSSDVTVNITVTPAAGNPNPLNQVGNAKLRDLVAVEVSVPYSSVAMIPASFLQGVTLTGRSHMRHE